MKRVTFGGLAFSALLIAAPLGTASGADLPVKGPSYAPAPMPVATWTGCYIGGNGGEAWSERNVTQTQFVTEPDNSTLGTASGTGGALGLQAGCDYQINSNWVFGVRGMWDWTNIKGNSAGFTLDGPSTFSFNATTFATAVARMGFLLTPQLMIYGLGGVATVNDKNTVTGGSGELSGNVQSSRTGFDVGAGFSWMLSSNWDFFVEYNYMDFGTGTITFNTNDNDNITTRVSQTEQSILAGVDWRFTNWGR